MRELKKDYDADAVFLCEATQAQPPFINGGIRRQGLVRAQSLRANPRCRLQPLAFPEPQR